MRTCGIISCGIELLLFCFNIHVDFDLNSPQNLIYMSTITFHCIKHLTILEMCNVALKYAKFMHESFANVN